MCLLHLLSSTLPYSLPPRKPLLALSYPICSVVIISRLSRSPTETSSRIHKFLGRIRGILQQRIPEIFSPKIFQKFVPRILFSRLLSFSTTPSYFFFFFSAIPPRPSRSFAERNTDEGTREREKFARSTNATRRSHNFRDRQHFVGIIKSLQTRSPSVSHDLP